VPTRTAKVVRFATGRFLSLRMRGAGEIACGIFPLEGLAYRRGGENQDFSPGRVAGVAFGKGGRALRAVRLDTVRGVAENGVS